MGHTPAMLMIMVIMRQVAENHDQGITTYIPDVSQEDREQIYSELGAFLFLKRPYTLSHLTKFLAALVKSAMSPPKWLVAARGMRKFSSKNEFKKALSFFNKLEENGFPTHHLGINLIRVKCLAELGELDEAIQALRVLELEYFKSSSIKRTLTALLIKQNKFEDAFESQLEVLRLQKSIGQFEYTLELMEQLCEAKLEGKQQFLIEESMQILDILKEDPLPYSRKTRTLLFQHISKGIKSPEHWLQLTKMVASETDILSATLPILKLGTKNIHVLVLQENEEAVECYLSSHIATLKVQPDSPLSIEVAADYYLREKDPESLDQILQNAEKAGANSLEYYVASAKLHLFKKDLKSASDTLHKAVQIQADDGRVVALREQWKVAYEAKSSK